MYVLFKQWVTTCDVTNTLTSITKLWMFFQIAELFAVFPLLALVFYSHWLNAGSSYIQYFILPLRL